MAKAQQQQPTVQPPPPQQTAPSSAQPQPAAPQPVRPPEEPNVLEDGGFSIEPIYWLTRAQPMLHGGAAASTFEGLDYPGHSNAGIGGELSIPTGHSNTLRFSYFRILGNADTTVTQSTVVFSQGYTPGDYLTQHYNLQSAKVSWDYLSYTWRKTPGNIHFKTLYEMQFATISTDIAAPFKAVTADTSGNVNDNTTHGSKNIVLPTLGVEFEQELGGRVRWEIKGSGFGIPHHSVLWDAQADIAIRISRFELIAGEKAFHFKTSPQAEQYFTDTLSGVFGGIRYYLSSRK